MAKQVQFRRGTTAQHATFTGAAGELTIDTDKKVPVVHDGSTAGGVPVAKASDLTAIDPRGRHTIPLPAGAFKARATSGAAAVTYDSGSNDTTLQGWGFDDTTLELIHSAPILMPKSWNEGTVTAEILWTNASGSSTQTVRWGIQMHAVGDGDSLNISFGTVTNIDDTWIAQNSLHRTAESGAITIGGTPAEMDAVIIAISRDPTNDNMTGDAIFLGMRLFVTLNAATDA